MEDMAELTIQLQRNNPRGGLELRVSLVSDEDSLPLEHERLHRALVLGILPRLDLDEPGEVHVWREKPALEPALG
jgi:hypothetical protein